MDALGPDIVRQAAEWMARMWSGDAGDGNQQACAAWRAAHPDHERAWQELQVFEDKLRSVPPEVARRTLREPAATTHAARRRVLQMLGWGAAGGGLAWMAHGTEAWSVAAADLRTGTGEIRETILSEGTRVLLSTATAVDVRFTESERLIVLHAGEILVSSSPNPSLRSPLRVRSRHGSVQALGTRFTVRQIDELSQVAVFEGAVEVRPAQAPGRMARLQAGQGTRFSMERVETPDAARQSDAAWSRGMLVADAMRLEDFIAELARYRPGLLSCEPAVAELRVSGVFPLRDTDRALHNLSAGLPVAISYRSRYWVTVRAAPPVDDRSEEEALQKNRLRN